jgi:hypothetical protein
VTGIALDSARPLASISFSTTASGDARDSSATSVAINRDSMPRSHLACRSQPWPCRPRYSHSLAHIPSHSFQSTGEVNSMGTDSPTAICTSTDVVVLANSGFVVACLVTAARLAAIGILPGSPHECMRQFPVIGPSICDSLAHVTQQAEPG